MNLCGFSYEHNWKLIYSASTDGFSAKDYHSKCDKIENTLLLIKSTHQNIFGGYMAKALDPNTEWINDPSAFIFSLVNKKKSPFISKCLNSGVEAICYNPSYGPVFGGGASVGGGIDLKLASNSNVNKESFSNFGFSYKHEKYAKKSFEAQTILAGEYKFQTVDIEVYKQIK